MLIKFIDLDGGEPKDPGKYNGEGAIASQIVDESACEGTDNYRWTWNNEQWKYANFNVTNSELTSIFDKGKSDALKQIETSVDLDGSSFGINSKISLAHFLSQSGHEVGGFTKGFDIEENLNYSVDGLITTFGKYFYKGTTVKGKLDASLYGYIKDANGKFKPGIITLNAVSEEILSPGKIYRDAALKRRCLVLSTGFFEWRHIYPLNKRTGLPLKTALKYPYFISLKEKEYFYMAGIWQPWVDKATGEFVESFAIVTTKANKLMEQIHTSKKRMPTILNEDLAYEWLLGNIDEKRILEIAASQYPASEMEACTIAKDFREALEPAKEFEYEDLPALDLNFAQ